MIRLANLHLRFMNSNEEDSAPTTKVTGGTMKGTVNFVQMTAVMVSAEDTSQEIILQENNIEMILMIENPPFNDDDENNRPADEDENNNQPANDNVLTGKTTRHLNNNVFWSTDSYYVRMMMIRIIFSVVPSFYCPTNQMGQIHMALNITN
jgi:hypothetical protein